MSGLVDSLRDRASTSALRDPAPEGAVLDRILETALRAPDHGRLRPWRFLLIRGDALQDLAAIADDALLRREPDATPAQRDKQRGKMLRAPLVIALVARITPSHKIPEEEQVMSAAAASMNLLNAAHAEGFGAIWITGANCYDASVQQALGVRSPERLIGFLFVGTPREPAAPVQRPSLADHVWEWAGLSAGRRSGA